jgi:small subunit ribosomal protein S8
MINYTVSDMITRIRNAIRVKKASVIVRLTVQTQRISEILKREGYIEEIVLHAAPIHAKPSRIRNRARGKIILHLKYEGKQRMEAHSSDQGRSPKSFDRTAGQLSIPIQSRSSMRPVFSNLQCISRPGVRSYAKSKNIPQILGGLGMLIISTNQGIMTDKEARERNLGGELLFSIW